MFSFFIPLLLQTSKMEDFATTINEAVKYCYKALHLRCSQRSWLCLYFFHVALFSCCTILILKNIENERKTENTTKKTILHSALWTCFILTLISYNIFLSLHSFKWLIKWKGTNLLFYWKNYVCQGLKLLKLGCELKLTSPRHKILSISCRYFNYDIENERTHKKYTCPEKILVLVPLFSKLLNYNYRPKEISLSNNLLKNKVLSYLFSCSRL